MNDTKNETRDTLSPTPIKSTSKNTEGEVLMNFSQALEVVVLGKKIHKLEWKDRNCYGFIEDEILMLHKGDDTTHRWILNKGDITGTDYVIV